MAAAVKDEWGIWAMRDVVDGTAGYAARKRVIAWRLATGLVEVAGAVASHTEANNR